MLKDDPGGRFTLWTHLARSNPQWRDFENNPNVLAIFTGPNSYISPTYYKNPLNVPTWSYTAVHVKGTVEVIHDEILERQLMEQLVRHYETKNGTNWNYSLPEEFHSKLLKGIVWLKITADKVDGKFKLSQNRQKVDYDSVLAEFEKRQSDNDRELLRYMRLTTPEKLR